MRNQLLLIEKKAIYYGTGAELVGDYAYSTAHPLDSHFT
jgi:hypothetical protein